MQTSDFGLYLIEAYEGFVAKPYYCPAGVLTQGFGHTAAAGPPAIGGMWTREQARSVLRNDLARQYEPGVLKLLKRTPTQGQFDAMVSFAYNCGLDAFRRSSILKFFNRGEDAQAVGAFALWVKATVKGQRVTVSGLVRRRASEALAYRGFKDMNFDGRLDTGEPVYGPMPQKVEPEREKIGKSRTAQGIGTATAGQVIQQSAETIEQAKQSLEPVAGALPNLVGVLATIGVALTLAGLAYTAYAKWDDMGRPVPWARFGS